MLIIHITPPPTPWSMSCFSPGSQCCRKWFVNVQSGADPYCVWRTALHCTALLGTSLKWLHWAALHCTDINEPHINALHCTAQHFIALYCTALHCSPPHCIALHGTALHCTALLCTALHCITLHLTELDCTLLRCNAIPSLIICNIRIGGPKKSRHFTTISGTKQCFFLTRYVWQFEGKYGCSVIVWYLRLLSNIGHR